MKEEFELIAKTFQGLEEVLAKELTELGASNIEIGRRMVAFMGDKEMMYKANFCLRTAIRILKPIKHFEAKNADEVYEAIKTIAWENFLDKDKSFAVDAVVFSNEFRHSKFVAYKVKDAIVDYFREKTGERPSVRINHPDVALNIHIAEDKCTLSLDSSGESLHRRGYRQEAGDLRPTGDAGFDKVAYHILINQLGVFFGMFQHVRAGTYYGFQCKERIRHRFARRFQQVCQSRTDSLYIA